MPSMNFPAFLQVPRVEKALAFELGHRHVVPANKHPPVFEVSKEAIVFLVAAHVFFEVSEHDSLRCSVNVFIILLLFSGVKRWL